MVIKNGILGLKEGISLESILVKSDIKLRVAGRGLDRVELEVL